MNKKTMQSKSLTIIASWMVITAIVVTFLVIASHLIIPLVFAILIWYLINTIEKSLSHIRVMGLQIPRWLRLLGTIVGLAMVFNIVSGIIATNVTKVIEVAPQYQRNLDKLLLNLPFGIELEEIPAISWLTRELNIAVFMQMAAREIANLLGNIGLIMIYLVFLFMEQRYFSRKLMMAAGADKNYRFVRNLLFQIDRDIRRYIGIKTLLSFVTAMGSYAILKWVGLEFASFWALLIFIFNFIPNIGSIAATILPVLLALLQFHTAGPALVVLFSVGSIQIVIGNFIDPALMGKSLNVSPLMIVLSLVFWGVIWKLPGMFLSVPITVIIMIILNSFENTRGIARLLSRDGNLKNLHTS